MGDQECDQNTICESSFCIIKKLRRIKSPCTNFQQHLSLKHWMFLTLGKSFPVRVVEEWKNYKILSCVTCFQVQRNTVDSLVCKICKRVIKINEVYLLNHHSFVSFFKYRFLVRKKMYSHVAWWPLNLFLFAEPKRKYQEVYEIHIRSNYFHIYSSSLKISSKEYILLIFIS